MSFNQIAIESALVNALKTRVGAGYTYYDEQVPTSTTLKLDAYGNVLNYIVYQISDIRYNGNGSFAGVRWGEYHILFDVQVVSSEPSITKAIRARVNDKMLGYKVPNAGELEKRFGVGDWVIVDEQNKPQAYVSSVAFRCNVDVVTGYEWS